MPGNRRNPMEKFRWTRKKLDAIDQDRREIHREQKNTHRAKSEELGQRDWMKQIKTERQTDVLSQSRVHPNNTQIILRQLIVNYSQIFGYIQGSAK